MPLRLRACLGATWRREPAPPPPSPRITALSPLSPSPQAFLLSVCHVVLVFSDGLADPRPVRTVLLADTLLPSAAGLGLPQPPPPVAAGPSSLSPSPSSSSLAASAAAAAPSSASQQPQPQPPPPQQPQPQPHAGADAALSALLSRGPAELVFVSARVPGPDFAWPRLGPARAALRRLLAAAPSLRPLASADQALFPPPSTTSPGGSSPTRPCPGFWALPPWDAPTALDRALGAEPPASLPALSSRLRAAVLSAPRRLPAPAGQRVSERDWLRAAQRLWAAIGGEAGSTSAAAAAARAECEAALEGRQAGAHAAGGGVPRPLLPAEGGAGP